MLTMISGKMCNSATNITLTMMCYICCLISKDFNDLLKKTDVKCRVWTVNCTYQFCLFESLLLLAHKLLVVNWRLMAEDEITIVKQKKFKILKKI